MKIKTLTFISTMLISTTVFCQNENMTMVYIETLQVTEIFGKVGDTLKIKGSDYGKDSIESAMYILKDQYGSYEASIKYRAEKEIQKFCFKGDKKSHEIIAVPSYNEKGEIIGNRERVTWKPKKLKSCGDN